MGKRMKWFFAILIVLVLLALLVLVLRQVAIPSRRKVQDDKLKPRPELSPVQQIQGIPPTSGQRGRHQGRVHEEIEERCKSNH
jgi:hypothetical protein